MFFISQAQALEAETAEEGGRLRAFQGGRLDLAPRAFPGAPSRVVRGVPEPKAARRWPALCMLTVRHVH